MASANCTIVGKLKSDGTFDTTNAAYVGLGNKNTAELYPYWLKFITPTFSGKSSSITFNLSMLWGYRNGTKSAKVNLRWALCTSSDNQASYNTVAACAGVSDPNQITSGTITFDGLTNNYQTKTLTISTTELKSGVSYFLVLWGDDSAGYVGDTATMNASTGHSAVLNFISGAVRIDTGSGWVTAVPYIDTGSEWVPATALKDNGSDWDPCV